MTVVLQEMRRLLPAILGLAAASCGAAALLGYFSWGFWWGMVLGVLFSLLHFWLIGLGAVQATQLSAGGALVKMTSGYFMRTFLVGVAIYLALSAPFLNAWGFIIPLFFPKLAIYGTAVLRKGARR